MEFVKPLFKNLNRFQRAIITFTQKRLKFNDNDRGKIDDYQEICKTRWQSISRNALNTWALMRQD